MFIRIRFRFSNVNDQFLMSEALVLDQAWWKDSLLLAYEG